ncbi:hypothetical protein [Streptomyces sp. NPDC002851]
MSQLLSRTGSAVLLILGLLVIGYAGYEGAYAAGLAGADGKLKVTECAVKNPDNAARNSRKGRQNMRCYGTFVPGGAKGTTAARDTSAYVDIKAGYPEGAELSVRRQPGPTLIPEISTDGGYVVVTAKNALRWTAGLLGGLALTGLGVFCAGTGYSPFGRSRVTFDGAWDAAGRGALRPTVIGMLGVGVAGAALAWLVSLFL